jgi:hypothetical protein
MNGVCWNYVKMPNDVDGFVPEDIFESQDDPLRFDKKIKFVQAKHKVSNMSWFDKLKIKPHTKARFGIPL